MLKFIGIILTLTLAYPSLAQQKVPPKSVEEAFNLIFQNPDKAIITLQQLEKDTKNQKDSLHSLVLNHIGVYHAVRSDLTQAGYYFDKSLKQAEKGSKTYVNSLKNRAVIYKKLGKIDKSLEVLDQALKIAQAKKFKDTEAVVYGEMGSCYSAQEDYENALYYLIKSIDVWELITPTDQKKIAFEKQKLANLYLKMNNEDYALQLYKEIIPIFRTNGDIYNLYLCQINEATIYIDLENPTKAYELLDDALLQLEKYDNKELILFARERKAKALELLKQYDNAIESYKKAFEYGLQYNQIRTVYTFIEMGNLLVSQNKFSDLSNYISVSEGPVFQNLFQLTTTEDQKRYYELLIAYYQVQNSYPEKMSYYEKMRDEKDQILQSKYNLYKVREKLTAYRLTLAEKEATISAQKLAIQRIKIFILTGFGIFLIVLALILFSRFNYKKKLLKFKLEKISQEKQIVEEQIEKEKEISAKRMLKIKKQEQDLLAQTLQKVESDKLLDQLVADFKSEMSPKKLKTIKALQNGGSNFWKSVLEKFDKINPDFNQILIEGYPQLTKGDRDFCSFVKLNLSNKEIAHLLQISPESVITKKYRILKKLGLPKDIEFIPWLNQLGN